MSSRRKIRVLRHPVALAIAMLLVCSPRLTLAQASRPQNEVDVRSAISGMEASSRFRFTYRDAVIDGKTIGRSFVGDDLESFLAELRRMGISSVIDSTLGQVLLSSGRPQRQTSIIARIVDRDTGEGLSFATVAWMTPDGLQGVAASDLGISVVPLSVVETLDSTETIRVSYVGYKPATLSVAQLMHARSVLVKLEPAPSFAPEIVVSDLLLETELDSAFVRLLDHRLASPLGEANVMKSLQALPSVSISNGLSSGLNVRGSRTDGFQVLLDGVPIYNQSHFFGMFDALNEDALKTVGFFYGITPSGYQAPPGGTLSFVTRSGSRTKVQQVYGVSNTSAKMTLDGPIPGIVGSWIFSLRHSFLNEVNWFNNKRLIEQGLNVNRETSELSLITPLRNVIVPGAANASFRDAHGKVVVDVSSRTQVLASVYSGGDESRQTGRRYIPADDPNDTQSRVRLTDVETRYDFGSDASSLQLQHATTGGVLLRSRLGLSRFRSDYSKDDFTYSIPPLAPQREGGFAFVDTLANSNSLRDLIVAQDISVFRSAGDINAGVSVHSYGTEFFEDSAIRGLPYSEEVDATLTEGYIELNGLHRRGLGLLAGTRIHHFSNGNFLYLSPRMRIQLGGKRASLYAGYSRNYQFLHQLYVENAVGSYFWTISREDEPPGEAHNWIVGTTLRPDPSMVIQLDAYLKHFYNLRQHESLVGRRRLRNDGAVLSPWVTDTQGESSGLEVMIRNQLGRLTVTNSYTLSETTVHNESIQNDRVFPAEWDRRHQYTARVAANISPVVTLDAAFSLATGAPNVLSFTDAAEQERLGVYHRLDVGAEINRKVSGASVQFRVSIFNVYDRNNPWYRTTVGGYDPDKVRDGISFVGADVYDLGFQPSFELKVRL